MTHTPQDWNNPDFYNAGKVHDWKNYVSGEVEDEWKYFSEEQKQILARCFQRLADREEWD